MRLKFILTVLYKLQRGSMPRSNRIHVLSTRGTTSSGWALFLCSAIKVLNQPRDDRGILGLEGSVKLTWYRPNLSLSKNNY